MTVEQQAAILPGVTEVLSDLADAVANVKQTSLDVNYNFNR